MRSARAGRNRAGYFREGRTQFGALHRTVLLVALRPQVAVVHRLSATRCGGTVKECACESHGRNRTYIRRPRLGRKRQSVPVLCQATRRLLHSRTPTTTHLAKMQFARQAQFLWMLVALLLVLPATQARPACTPDEVADEGTRLVM